MNVECGMGNGEEEMVECLIYIFSAFQLPHSKVPDTTHLTPNIHKK